MPKKLPAYAKINTKGGIYMQDGENPAALGAASGSAPSNGQSARPKIGLNFDPANIFGEKALAAAAIPATDDDTAGPVVVPVAQAELMNASIVDDASNGGEELDDAVLDEPDEIQYEGAPAAESENAEETGADELENEIETENLETPILDNIPINEKGPDLLNSTRPSAPPKRSVSPAIIIFICVIGILVVGVILLVTMHLASKAAPAVEEVVEKVEEKVEEEASERHITLPKKKKTEEKTGEEEETDEEQPAAEEQPEDTSVYIELPTPQVRIKLPETENYIDYRIIGDKVFFWAATKRDGVEFTEPTNCTNAEDENCLQESTIPEFADRSMNTDGMAFIQWWPMENSDYDTEAYRNGRWILYYSTHKPGEMPKAYSTDPDQAQWENESLMFLADFLANQDNYSAIETE